MLLPTKRADAKGSLGNTHFLRGSRLGSHSGAEQDRSEEPGQSGSTIPVDCYGGIGERSACPTVNSYFKRETIRDRYTKSDSRARRKACCIVERERWIESAVRQTILVDDFLRENVHDAGLDVRAQDGVFFAERVHEIRASGLGSRDRSRDPSERYPKSRACLARWCS